MMRGVSLAVLGVSSAEDGRVFVRVDMQNAVPTGSKKTLSSIDECEASCTGSCLQYSWNKKSKHCYTSKDSKWSPLASDHIESGCIPEKVKHCPGSPTPPAPTPPPSPTSTCVSDADCSRNGLCTDGSCVCDAAWTGQTCETFNIIPGDKHCGYRWIDPVEEGGNRTSSWGAANWYDEQDETWYMYATELAGHCGMHSWTMNSHTILASSKDPLGLYKREQEIVPIWSHEVEVARAPTGEYVAYFSYANYTGGWQICETCTDSTTDPKCPKRKDLGAGSGVSIESTDATYMSWAPRPHGPWSKPVLVQPGKVQMDSNFAGVIKEDGSFVGMWRDHHPGGHHSTPHPVTAANWKDPSTYKFGSTVLFPAVDKKGGIEDMFIWVVARKNYHAIFHMMYDCDNCVGHAHSADGNSWTWTGIAATADTVYKDGTSATFSHLERPQLVFAKDGKTPIALTNGVKTEQTGLANNDQSFTLLRPLQQVPAHDAS